MCEHQRCVLKSKQHDFDIVNASFHRRGRPDIFVMLSIFFFFFLVRYLLHLILIHIIFFSLHFICGSRLWWFGECRCVDSPTYCCLHSFWPLVGVWNNNKIGRNKSNVWSSSSTCLWVTLRCAVRVHADDDFYITANNWCVWCWPGTLCPQRHRRMVAKCPIRFSTHLHRMDWSFVNQLIQKTQTEQPVWLCRCCHFDDNDNVNSQSHCSRTHNLTIYYVHRDDHNWNNCHFNLFVILLLYMRVQFAVANSDEKKN